jgi:hypothetical protein
VRVADIPDFDPARHPPLDPDDPPVAELLAWFGRLQTHLQASVDYVDVDGFDVIAGVAECCRASGFEPLGMGSTRVAVPLQNKRSGAVYSVKLTWNSYGRGRNLWQAIRWMAMNDERAMHAVPCFVLTTDELLVTPFARPVAPAFDPTLLDVPLDQAQMVYARLRIDLAGGQLKDTHRAAERWGEEARAADAILGIGADEPLRLNNYGLFDGRLVNVDAAHRPPVDVDMDDAVQWVREQLEHGDLVLDRGSTRDAMLAALAREQTGEPEWAVPNEVAAPASVPD